MEKQLIATDGEIGIVDIEYGINDYVILLDGDKCRIKYNVDGKAFFVTGELTCFLCDFIKV